MNRSGKIFSVGLVDSSGEIQAVGFDHLAERFYAKLEIEKVSRILANCIHYLILFIDLLHIQG